MAKKIFLADDSITIQKVVELTFAEGDYQVVCASDGVQAIRKIEETVPDIALIDVMMPQRNGYEVCEHVKKDPNLAWIPVLLLTGTFEPYDPKRAEEAGADGHIIKPFESRALVGQVEELIGRSSRPVDSAAAEQPVGATPLAPPQAPAQPPAPVPEAAGIPRGPATVRMDSREILDQLGPAAAGGEVVSDEIPASPPEEPPAPAPSLGPLDLGADEGIEPTHPLKMKQTEGGGAAASVPERAGPAAPSPEGIESEARPLIEKAVERILREVAWEVIPDLAERIIKKRIRELEDEAAPREDASLH